MREVWNTDFTECDTVPINTQELLEDEGHLGRQLRDLLNALTPWLEETTDTGEGAVVTARPQLVTVKTHLGYPVNKITLQL